MEREPSLAWRRNRPKSEIGVEAVSTGVKTAAIVAEDRRDCYWLYVVTSCDKKPELQPPIKDPARLEWHELVKVEHYYLSVNALTKPMQLSETGKAGWSAE